MSYRTHFHLNMLRRAQPTTSRLSRFGVAIMTLAIVAVASNVHGDAILTTSTLDSAALDFDGGGVETDGSLGVNSKMFSLSGSEIPSDPEFANITSIQLDFGANAGNELSARAGGILPPGIGIARTIETADENVGSLSNSEILSMSVSSTSTIAAEQVLFSGIQFNSWRNFFPFSEVTLTGATFNGGQTVLTGADGLSGPTPLLMFDAPVSSFSVESTGADDIRMSDIRLTVSSIPEPGSAAMLLTAVGYFVCIRRRRQ